jgi:L-lactate dehydrogenase complex protein LldF
MAYKGFAFLYSRPALYRMFAWAATRFRFLTPSNQAGWTVTRTPLKPAEKSLRDLLAERRNREN